MSVGPDRAQIGCRVTELNRDFLVMSDCSREYPGHPKQRCEDLEHAPFASIGRSLPPGRVCRRRRGASPIPPR